MDVNDHKFEYYKYIKKLQSMIPLSLNYFIPTIFFCSRFKFELRIMVAGCLVTLVTLSNLVTLFTLKINVLKVKDSRRERFADPPPSENVVHSPKKPHLAALDLT